MMHATMIELTESTPAFGIYGLAEAMSGDIVDAPDSGAHLTGIGFPSAPDDEVGLSNWLIPKATLTGYFDAEGRGLRNPEAGPLRPISVATGQLAVLLTDKAMRISVLKGKSVQLGLFQAGRRNGFRSMPQTRIRTLACTWRYEDIWALNMPGDPGPVQRLDVVGPSGVGLSVKKARAAQTAFFANGSGLSNNVADLAARLTEAVIWQAVGSGDPMRIAAAEAVRDGVRDSPKPDQRVARFRRSTNGPAS
jgi:hypothetical protein